MATDIIKRADARAQGLKRYFTGKCCKRGHIAERYVSNLECVVCVFEKTKARQWHIHNRERKRELSQRDYQKRKDAIGAYRRKWKAENPDYAKNYWHSRDPEFRKAKKREWYVANRQHAIAYTTRWVIENPDAAKEIYALAARRRRSRKLEAGGHHTQADLAALLKVQNHRCAYCRADLRKVKKHADHIQPLSRGGSNDKSNIQWLCAPCNSKKGARDPVQFAQELGRLL